MINKARQKFNESFSEERYRLFLEDITQTAGHDVAFRVAESPFFVSADFKKKLLKASREILGLLKNDDIIKASNEAVPEKFKVPNETAHPLFFALDFAVTKDEQGQLQPRLIELQGFPSLFAWQDFLPKKFREHFEIPKNYKNHFVKQSTYEQILTKAILENEEPQHVILLEIEPLKQNTSIDFVLTEKMLGVKPVHISDVRKEGKKLFYEREGQRIQIRRIYNRVIFDELVQRNDLNLPFNLVEEVDVTWAGHPNWFFKMSKCIMPHLKSEFVPMCHFVSDLDIFPENPQDFVLKPLYSFSGSGVIFNVTKKDLESIPRKDRSNFILQKKVNYEPVVQSPDGPVKVEIRLMFIWEPGNAEPTLVTNLARLSRGEMIGVKYNKDKTWVGGSVCFFEP